MSPRRTLPVVSTDLTVDRLPEAGPSLEVVLLEDASFGSEHRTRSAAPAPPRLPRADLDAQRRRPSPVDGEVSRGRAGTRSTLIGRGQVHVFERARRALRRGRALRRRAAARRRGRAREPGVAARRPRRSHGRSPGGRRAAARGSDRGARGGDAPPARLRAASICSATCSSALLLWVERWYEAGAHPAARRGRRGAPAVPALRRRARARLRPPPRRRPLRGRARVSRRQSCRAR